MMVYECLMLMLMLCKSSYARLTPEVLQYRVPLELPLDLDEAHSSDRVVTVNMPLPMWGEIDPTCN